MNQLKIKEFILIKWEKLLSIVQFNKIYEMIEALENIVEVTYNNTTYFVSIVKKQNDSAIMFNQRTFYLVPTQCIGYLSQAKINDPLNAISFSNPKMEISISNITNSFLHSNELTITFLENINGKKIERAWLLKMESSVLAKKWWDKLIKQQKDEIQRNTPQKKQKSRTSHQTEKIEKNSIKEAKILQISKNIDFSETLKKQKDIKDVGVNANIKDELQIKIQPTQKKDFGTGMSPKVEYKKIVMQQKNLPEVKQSVKLLKISEQMKNVKDSETQYNIQNKRLTLKKQQSIHISSYNQSDHLLPNNIQIKRENIIVQDIKISSNIQKPPHHEQLRISKDYSINIQINNSISRKQSIFRLSLIKNNQNLQQWLIPVNRIGSNSKADISMQSMKGSQDEKSNHRSQSSLSVAQSIKSQHSAKSFRSYMQNNYNAYQDMQNPNLPWTFKYLKYNDQVFEQFKKYSKNILTDLIQDYKIAKQERIFKPILINNEVYHYQIKDLSVKIALVNNQLIEDKNETINSSKISNRDPSKLLNSQFNYFQELYRNLGNNSRLKAPLVCLCEVNGFIGLFKALYRSTSNKINMQQIQSQIKHLSQTLNINPVYLKNANKFIIKLDDVYYNALRKGQDQQNKFNYYFFQEIDNFILPKQFTSYLNEAILIPRKQLKNNSRQINIQLKVMNNFKIKALQSGKNDEETEIFIKNIKNALLAAILQIDSLQVYFFSSKQLSNYLHSKGINICFIGFLYDNITNAFQKNILMTEAAARSCKKILRKTIKEMIMKTNQPQKQNINNIIRDFLNNVLQNPFNNAYLWNIIKEDCLTSFGVNVSLESIAKQYFLLSLIQCCKIDVIWQKLQPNLVFKQKFFFSEQNFKGIVPHFKIYAPYYNQQYELICQIMEQQKTQERFEDLMNYLNLHTDSIPLQLNLFESKINRYLSYFISPDQAKLEYQHLNLYDICQSSCPSEDLFNSQLMKIKWFLKSNQKERYVDCCNNFVKFVTNYYGQFFPVLSELYDLLSTYHLTNGNHQDAITFAKSSLVNMINICGINHEKSAQCYFQLGLYYFKANRLNEAFIEIKKSKIIFETIKMTDTAIYALVCLKIGLLYLKFNQIQTCLVQGLKALSMFQSLNLPQYEDEITECYEMITRCYQLTNCINKLREISQKCSQKLLNIANLNNLEKMLKIYLSSILSDLTPENASDYRDIIGKLTPIFNELQFDACAKLIRSRLTEGIFKNNIYYYLGKLNHLKEQIFSTNILQKWHTFRKIYPRQTVEDFVSLTEELIVFLGEEFVTNLLRH